MTSEKVTARKKKEKNPNKNIFDFSQYLNIYFSFFKKLHVSVCPCMWAYACECRCPSGSEMTDSLKLKLQAIVNIPEVGARNPIQVLWKNS